MNNVTHHKIGYWMKFKLAVAKNRLAFALILAIITSLVLVGISVNIYTLAGFNRYDLSRPGYEKERQEVSKPAPLNNYDTTSTITSQSLDDFLKEYDGRVKDIMTFGNFRDSSLGDDEIGVNDDSAIQADPNSPPPQQ